MGDGKGRWRDQEVFIRQDGPAACGWPREVHPEDRLTAQKEPEQDSKSRSRGHTVCISGRISQNPPNLGLQLVNKIPHFCVFYVG